jgi:M6 family metalloprotease-like protein
MRRFGLRGRFPACLLTASVALVAPSMLQGQDIETVARLRGLDLPAAYFARIQENPSAYTLPNGLFRETALGRVASRVDGEARIPVVLALFSDSEEPHITREMIQSSLFDGPAPAGTITEAYLEISRGALHVTGVVFPWVRTSQPMDSVVGANNGLGNDADLGPYLIEALELIEADVDWSQYDNDGPDGVPNSGDDDGIVDAVTFEYLEIAGSCGGTSIWPHRWGISGWTGGSYLTDDLGPSGDPIEIDGYLTQSVTGCTGENVQTANVMAHEFGHVLGLPDFYHPTASGVGAEGRRWVLGCWGLMAAGSWGCGPVVDRDEPFGPTHMSAHSKQQLGWIDYFDVGEVWNHEMFLEPVQNSGQALRIPLGPNGTEFFIAEFRTLEGFDEQIPAEGVLVYKQDLTASRRPDPLSNDPYFLSILEQDGNLGLKRNHLEGGNRGEAGDAWGVGGVSSKLHALTNPQLRLSNGATTTLTVHEVSVQDGRARLVISTGRTPQVIAPAESIEVERVATFARGIRIAGGAMPYSPLGSFPSGIVLVEDGDEIVISGSILDSDPIDITFMVRDVTGLLSDQVTVTVSTTPWVVELEQLLQKFLGTDLPQLSVGEISYLDAVGNGNGRYDVGDLRKWLRENPTGG